MRSIRGASWRRLAVAVSAAGISVGVGSVAAAQGRVRVEYDVELTTTGSVLDNCPQFGGTDVLKGTLVGFEPPAPNEPITYAGTLMRSTRMSMCGSRTTPRGDEVVCSINIAGGGFPDVKLTIEDGQRDGYLQYLDPGKEKAAWAPFLVPPPAGQAYSTVTGTCDPVELAQLQADYDGGQTAGSPNGQPVEVPSLPPPAYPHTFAARQPVSIWTLVVFARRP